MRTQSLLIAVMSIPMLAQVSRVAFSDSNDVVPAFDSSGAITLPAGRLKVDVIYPRGRKERCELTVVHDPKTGHYLWHRTDPNPNSPDDTGAFFKAIKAHRAAVFADESGITQFIFPSGLFAKTWRGRAASLDGAVSASTDEIRQGLAKFEDRGYHKEYKHVPIFGPLRGFDEKPPRGYKPISRDFWCEPFTAFCPNDNNTVVSISKAGNNWRLVIRNRFDVEVVLDQTLDLVSAQQLTQPKK